MSGIIFLKHCCLKYCPSFRPKRWFSTNKQLKNLTQSYVHGQGNMPLIGLTIGQSLSKTVSKHGEREAIVSSEQNIRKTFHQFQEDVDSMAKGFLELGLKKGARVGMFGPNSYEWALTQFATAQAGLVLVTINPAYMTQELEYCLKKVQCEAIIMPLTFKTNNYYQMLSEIIPSLPDSKPDHIQSQRLPQLQNIITLGAKKMGGTYTFSEIMSIGQNSSNNKLDTIKNELQFDDPVNILFTSGTTGHPKAVTLSHHNVVNNALLIGYQMQYNEDSRICIPVPLYHCLGSIVGALCAALFGACVVYPKAGFNPEQTLKVIQDEKCTVVYGTPTYYIDMLNVPNFHKYSISSLQTGIMTGAACPAELMRKVINQMGIPHLTICYGATETSPVSVLVKPTDCEERRTTTVGQPLPHTEIKIVDSEEKVLAVNTKGELFVRGYCNMIGYWEDEEKTKETITPTNWYKSGDIAVMDEDGYICIEGRIKDLIIRGGTNIYPAEIEQFFYSHPSIEEVQVIGIPDERLGEEICAWIRMKLNHKVSEDEIKNFCKGKIAHFKIPKYIIFRDEFPKTASGKIQKFKMKEISMNILGLNKS